MCHHDVDVPLQPSLYTAVQLLEFDMCVHNDIVTRHSLPTAIGYLRPSSGVPYTISMAGHDAYLLLRTQGVEELHQEQPVVHLYC